MNKGKKKRKYFNIFEKMEKDKTIFFLCVLTKQKNTLYVFFNQKKNIKQISCFEKHIKQFSCFKKFFLVEKMKKKRIVKGWFYNLVSILF